MTNHTLAREVVAGDEITVLVAGLTIGTGDWMNPGAFVADRGTVFRVTQQQIDNARNRHGELGGIALAGDADAQIKKWGQQRFALGRLQLDPWVQGDPRWQEAREQARRAAWAETDPERRAAALQAVSERFGAGPTTSVHTKAPALDYWDAKAAAREAEAVELRRQGQQHVNRSIDNDPAWTAERAAAMRAALAEEDSERRAAAVEKIRRLYPKAHA